MKRIRPVTKEICIQLNGIQGWNGWLNPCANKAHGEKYDKMPRCKDFQAPVYIEVPIGKIIADKLGLVFLGDEKNLGFMFQFKEHSTKEEAVQELEKFLENQTEITEEVLIKKYGFGYPN